MNNFSGWAGTKNKTPTKIHSRPNRSLYNKLRPHSENVNRNGRDTSVFQNVPSAELQFLASDDDDSSDEEEIVTFQLTEVNRFKNEKRGQSRAKHTFSEKRRTTATNYIERDIEKGDTLRSLSLRYGCKVSEIKRVNNLINDQEFFGLRKIKVPVKEYGLVKEQLERENDLKLQMKTKEIANAYISRIGVKDRWKLNDSGATVISIRHNQDARDFLQKMDADLERIRQSTKTEKDTLEEVAYSLTCKRFHPFAESSHTWHFPKLKVLLLIGFVALVVIPIVFISVMVHRKHLKDSKPNQ